MDEGFRSVMDELKRPVLGETVGVVNDRIRKAAILIEKLAAEREYLKARCEAAERDINAMLGRVDHWRYGLCVYCDGFWSRDCYPGNAKCITGAKWRGPCFENGGARDDHKAPAQSS